MQPGLRKWAHGAVIAVAAFASIATPQKKWILDAKRPAYADDTTQERDLVVSAWREPELAWESVDGSAWGMLQPTKPPTLWPGTVTYHLARGQKINYLHLAHGCGGMCSSCEIPADAYIRIDRVGHPSWTLEAPRRGFNHAIGNDVHLGRVVVTIDATQPVTVEIAPNPSTKFVPTATKLDEHRYAIEFRDYQVTSNIVYSWSIIATIHGPCANAVCDVPAGEHVTITGVADEP